MKISCEWNQINQYNFKLRETYADLFGIEYPAIYVLWKIDILDNSDSKNTVDDKCFIHICSYLPEITRPIHFSYRSSTPGSQNHRCIPFLLWSCTHISTQDPRSYSLVCPPEILGHSRYIDGMNS